ncbi:DNA cytosine methyltransferase [Morganella morganii]|nr:DNA cytosine methyltransferase [Morganella morganii]
MATAYYNENDPFAAQRLRDLIAAGHIAAGVVDERSIEDVIPSDLHGFTQCHFFAGVGVWSYSLRLAGWPDNKPVWTGSCPCQPFSAAGKGTAFTDERHLWPAFFHLISECKPGIIFGEQVASKDGLAWLDLVQTDLEATGYTIGAQDLCAAGFGAPHQRQRLFWVADTISGQLPGGGDIRETGRNESTDSCATGWMANTKGERHKRGISGSAEDNCQKKCGSAIELAGFRQIGRLDNAECIGRQPGRNRNNAGNDGQQFSPAVKNDFTSPTNGYWRDADWLFCRDGFWRPVEPGTFPLANGVTSRVGKIKTYGNAIVAPVAEEFIKTYMEIRNHE